MLDHSDASVMESLCSDASVDESLCFDGDVALQRDIQRIIYEHTNNVIKKWGNSEQWVLELRDGKRVAVPIHISLPPGDVVVRVEGSNHLAIPGVSSESTEFNSELDKKIDGFVEDWASDLCSEDTLQFTDSLPTLNVEPLAFSLPRDGKDIFEGSTSWDVEKFLGNVNHSEWFLEKFSGFDDFLGTSLKGLEELTTKFLLAVESELQQRAVKEKSEQAVKSSGKKGIRELRGLFSSINYGSASSRRLGNGKDKALIIPQ